MWEQTPNWCKQKHRLFWESPSSSAPLPVQNKLLLYLGSFKLIILGHVLGLGFILFKRVVARKKKRGFEFILFLWHFFIQCLIQCGAEELCLPRIRAALQNRALCSDGYQDFIPGHSDEGLLSYVLTSLSF